MNALYYDLDECLASRWLPVKMANCDYWFRTLTLQDDDSKREVSQDAPGETGDGDMTPLDRTDIAAGPKRLKRRRSMLWHISHTIGRTFSAVMTVALMVSLAAVLRIASGGLDFAPLKPYLDAELERQGFADIINFDSLVLRWDDRQNDLDLIANNVRISTVRDGDENRNMVVVPNVEIGIDLAEVLEGRLRVKELSLFDIYLSLNRSEDGVIELDVGLTKGSNDFGALTSGERSYQEPGALYSELQTILDQWALRGQGNALLSKLDRVSIENGWLNFNDLKNGEHYLAHDLHISAHRFADQIALTASGTLYVELADKDIGDPSLNIQAIYKSDKSLDVDIAVEGLHSAHALAMAPDYEDLQDLDLAISSTAQISVSPDGDASSIDFRIFGENGVLTRQDLFEKPLQIEALALEGVANWQDKRLDVSRATLKTDLPVIDGSFVYTENDDGPSLQIDAGLTGIPVSRLMEYWPKPAASLARTWTKEHITSGRTTGATVKLDLGPEVFDKGVDALTPGSVDFRFAYEDLTLELFPNFPPVTGIRGESFTDHETMRYTIEHGQGNNLNLTNGLVVFEKLYSDDPDAIIKFDASGKVGDALDLINRKPLELASEFGLDPKMIGGTADTTVVFAFPLTSSLALADVKVQTQAHLRDVIWLNAVAGMSLSEGVLELVADNEKFTLGGETRLNDVPVKVDWESRFGRDVVIRQKVNLYADLVPEDREKLKLPPLPGLDGFVGISVALFQNAEKTWSVFSTSDLLQAKLEIPHLGWTKPIGRPATLTTKTEFTPNVPVIISAIEAQFGDLSGKATVLLDAQSQDVHQVRVRDFVFGDTRTGFTLGKDGTGGWLGVIDGESLDLEPILTWYREDDDEDFIPSDLEQKESLPPVRLKVRVDQLHVTGNINISNFRADGRYVDDRIANLSASGHMADQGVALSITPAGDGRDISMTMSDVGDMLTFLSQSERIEGGRMIARGHFTDTVSGDTNLKGTVEVENFRLIEAPTLARLLNVATLLGIAAELEGQGIPFTKLEVPFHFKDKVLKVDNARASGTSMGITFRGIMDTRQEKVDFEGSVIPAYALNSIFGSIPILGKLLGGANEEGLLAVSYRIHGPSDNPNITVNPLSVLAPGVLRDVFSAILKGVQGDSLEEKAPEQKPTIPKIEK